MELGHLVGPEHPFAAYTNLGSYDAKAPSPFAAVIGIGDVADVYMLSRYAPGRRGEDKIRLTDEVSRQLFGNGVGDGAGGRVVILPDIHVPTSDTGTIARAMLDMVGGRGFASSGKAKK